MKLRKLTREDVNIFITVWPETDSIEGHFVSGVVNYIKKEIEKGNVWAWCTVLVEVQWKDGFSGAASLGCCSYESEEDFKNSGDYYDDMVNEALTDLNENISKTFQAIGSLLK